MLKYVVNALNNSDLRKSVLLIDFTSAIRANDTNYFFYSDNENSPGYNLGINRISAYLEKYNVPVKIVRYEDYKNETEWLLGIVEKFDIIGLNSLSFTVNSGFNLCKKIKEKFPNKIIIGGAEHFALDYKWILENQHLTGCDICCTMQGELPMLALSLGVDTSKIGSIAFIENGIVIKNNLYPYMTDNAEETLLNPVPVLNISKDIMKVAFPEFQSTFTNMGLTQTGSGCIFSCDFCTNFYFMGNRFNETLNTCKSEIKNFINNKIDFFFITNALLNSSKKQLNDFIDFIEDININKKIYWSCFYSIHKNIELQQFERLSKAGCLMINVGVEDIVGERADLKKGAKTIDAIEFTEKAKKHLLVRTLLILGLPNHYLYTREELKEKFLSYMKKHPQAIYRINHYTPIFGTSDFKKYEAFLDENPRMNIETIANFDTLHPLLNPKKMYDSLNVTNDIRWVIKSSDWSVLQKEIILEYMQSKEHQTFLDTLKGNKMLFKIAVSYKKLILNE